MSSVLSPVSKNILTDSNRKNQCKYVCRVGKNRGQQCDNQQAEGLNYCKSCLWKVEALESNGIYLPDPISKVSN